MTLWDWACLRCVVSAWVCAQAGPLVHGLLRDPEAAGGAQSFPATTLLWVDAVLAC